jgi:hypothetical protein
MKNLQGKQLQQFLKFKILNKQMLYLESLCLTYTITILWLSSYGEQRLEVYISLFSVGYFANTILYNPRKRWFDFVGLILFFVFSLLVIFNLIQIILN